MKRFLSVLMVIVLLLGVFPVALAEDKELEEHEHEWLKATCTEPRTCSICGATEGEPKGHKVEEWETTVKATCTETGEKSGECLRCGEMITEAYGPKGHKVEEWKTLEKATCTEPGERVGECTRCGERVDEEIPAAHKPAEKWTTIEEPTVDHKVRTRVKYCEVCGEECERKETELSNKEFREWFKENCKDYSYEKMMRDPDHYVGRKIKKTGYVLQVLNEHSSGYYIDYSYLVYTNTKSRDGDIIMVKLYSKPDKRILKGDKLSFWGVGAGEYSYETTGGWLNRIPEVTAYYWSIK